MPMHLNMSYTDFSCIGGQHSWSSGMGFSYGIVVVLVFVLNALPIFALELFLHIALAVGIFAGFTLYFIAYEEIHWRFHLGGWLPGWLHLARNHHLLHHGGFEGRYNVFLPIFDWLFQRSTWKHGS